jgi:hypothetical protein
VIVVVVLVLVVNLWAYFPTVAVTLDPELLIASSLLFSLLANLLLSLSFSFSGSFSLSLSIPSSNLDCLALRSLRCSAVSFFTPIPSPVIAAAPAPGELYEDDLNIEGRLAFIAGLAGGGAGVLVCDRVRLLLALEFKVICATSANRS